ncbi:MAG: PEP/pyruvate-binding domain-containing protein [Pseudolysinimonas sp.]|uniref:PEP/pyruvate-binding domain-containing protein n=1 Tax=Pseudolysinimonas sp. TaxID=2680009 RepID=UPI003C72EDBD
MYTTELADEACRDVREVGGKALGLAEMVADELPVSPAFTVVAAAYRAFLAQGDLRAQLDGILGNIAKPGDGAAYDKAERDILAVLGQTPLPSDVADQVRTSYEKLCRDTGVPDVAVAVRSSATAEDSVATSFAGEFETWVDIVGTADVLEHVRKCYLSVFSSRVLSYVAMKEIDPYSIEMAVVIQKTVRARAAGVMFTISPTSGDRSKIVLEANWGLGLSVVGGEVTPDRYVVEKVGLVVAERIMGDKRVEYRRGDALVEVPEDRRDAFCLTDAEVLALARFGKRLERLHGGAQDIEFAVDEELPDGSNLVLLQCRPETVWSNARRGPVFDPGGSVMSWISGSITGTNGGTYGAVDATHTSSTH